MGTPIDPAPRGRTRRRDVGLHPWWPGGSRSRPRLMYVSVRLAIFGICLSLAAAFLPLPGPVISLVIVGALGLFAAVDVALAPRASGLIIERHTPTVSSIGRTDEVAVEVSNPRPRDVEVALRDAAPPSLRRHPRIHRTV